MLLVFTRLGCLHTWCYWLKFHFFSLVCPSFVTWAIAYVRFPCSRTKIRVLTIYTALQILAFRQYHACCRFFLLLRNNHYCPNISKYLASSSVQLPFIFRCKAMLIVTGPRPPYTLTLVRAQSRTLCSSQPVYLLPHRHVFWVYVLFVIFVCLFVKVCFSPKRPTYIPLRKSSCQVPFFSFA